MPSIAVLPFMDLSPNHDQEYFSDGLAEELLSTLTRIPGLKVAARTSAFAFKGKNEDLQVIAQKLHVETILEGSVRKEGKRVRITTQLINAADGFHLWSETYDREMTDIFAIQDDIASSVAGALKVTLLGSKTPGMNAQENPEAYNAYLQGRYFFNEDKEDWQKAILSYEQALQIDSNFARAWAWLAFAHLRQARWGYVPNEEATRMRRMARKELERALELEPNLADAYAITGVIKMFDWDWTGADAALKRARELEPGNATAIWVSASLSGMLGRLNEAMALNHQATQLDPLNPRAYVTTAFYAAHAGRLDEAEAAARKALELNPQTGWCHWILGYIYLRESKPDIALTEMQQELEPLRSWGLILVYQTTGKKKEADAALAKFVEKNHETEAFEIAELYAYRGEVDKAFEWLDRAYKQHDVDFVKGNSFLRNLQSDPRYTAFLKKMHLPVN